MNKNYKRPTSEVVCAYCETSFQKENREITQSEKRGAKHYCNRSCAAKGTSASTLEGGIRPLRRYVSSCRKRAKSKGKECDLTLEYLEELYYSQQGEMCAITGLKMKLPSKTNTNYEGKDIYHASLDRIDNSKGYIQGNVQFTLLGINYMRNTFDVKDVVELLSNIQECTLP